MLMMLDDARPFVLTGQQWSFRFRFRGRKQIPADAHDALCSAELSSPSAQLMLMMLAAGFGPHSVHSS